MCIIMHEYHCRFEFLDFEECVYEVHFSNLKHSRKYLNLCGNFILYFLYSIHPLFFLFFFFLTRV